jgi:Na+/pantothenate symporter
MAKNRIIFDPEDLIFISEKEIKKLSRGKILLLLFILFIAKPNNLLTSAFGIAFGMFLFAFLMIEILILNKQKI